MDISSEPQTPKSAPLPGTYYIRHEAVDCDLQGEPAYTTLANHLVNEWLNQALDNYELAVGDTFYESDTCSPHYTSSRDEKQTVTISGDIIEHSVPALKDLCREALIISRNHLINLSVSQFHSEGKQAYGRCMNGMNWKSLSCNLSMTNVPHKQSCRNNLCATGTEFNANIHTSETGELSHSKGCIGHTKSETFLHHSMKGINYLEPDHRDDHSEHYVVSNHLRACDFGNLQNLVTANASRAEQNAEKNPCKFSHSNETDATLKQIQAPSPVVKLLHAGTDSLNNTSSVECMTDGCNAHVNADSDCITAHSDGLAISGLDPRENITCRVTSSLSYTVFSEVTDSSSQIYFSCPGVQVSFCLLYWKSGSHLLVTYFLIIFII